MGSAVTVMSALVTLLLVFVSTLTAVPYVSGDNFTATEEAADPCQIEMPVVVNYSTTVPNSLLHKDVTMCCEVEFRDASLSASTVATWWRWPESTASLANASLTQALTGNSFRIFLSLNNVTQLDQADYTLAGTFSVGDKNCSFSCPTMSLSVRDECYFKIPQPTRGNVTITTPIDVPSLTLVANFTGDTDRGHYRIVWSNGSVYDLEYFRTSQKYFTKHSKISSCLFTEELIITNISMTDAGVYTAEATGYFDSGNRTFFNVIIAETTKSAILTPLLGTLVTGIAIAAVLVLCSCIYIMYRKKKHLKKNDSAGQLLAQEQHHLEEQHDMYIDPERTYRDSPGTLRGSEECISEQKSVIFLYCREGITRDNLEELAEVLGFYGGIDPHLDLKVSLDNFPSNWSRWMETEIRTCRHVLVICTAPLYKALTEHINHPLQERGLVEMFEGAFYADSIVNCILPSKCCLVFLDRPRDLQLIPSELRTQKQFQLNITHLMAATEGKCDSLQVEISTNLNFGGFRELIEHLQK